MILKEIRSRTAENHLRLEQSPLLLPFASRDMDQETYKTILVKFYGYFQPIESILNNFTYLPRWLPDYPERRKTALLRQDLAHLSETVLLDLPTCSALPRLDTLSRAFGALYVMEGSTLGGKFIYQVIREKLQMDQQRGAAFFYGYGPETGARWKAFGQALEAFSTAHGTDEEIIAAANETFYLLEQWIKQPA